MERAFHQKYLRDRISIINELVCDGKVSMSDCMLEILCSSNRYTKLVKLILDKYDIQSRLFCAPKIDKIKFAPINPQTNNHYVVIFKGFECSLANSLDNARLNNNIGIQKCLLECINNMVITIKLLTKKLLYEHRIPKEIISYILCQVYEQKITTTDLT